MIAVFSFATSALAAPTTSVEADFDGDGKPEKVRVDGSELTLPGVETLYCEGSCELEVLDIATDRPGRELSACTHGPRDDRYCTLFRMEKGRWSLLAMPEGMFAPASVSAPGNGFLYATYEDRWVTRVEKLALKGTALVRTLQPFYSTVSERRPNGWTFTPDQSFPLVTEIGSSDLVANVIAKKPVTVLLEAAGPLRAGKDRPEDRWFLIRTSTGLVGYASLRTLISSTEMLQHMEGAG